MGNRIKLRPEQKIGEKDDLNRHWVGLFLDTLAETSNVTASARMAGCSVSRAYKFRREDSDFRRRWGEALLEGYEHLEMETLHRLRFGIGPDDPKFDIPNALRLLTAHRDAVSREKARRGKRDRAAVLASLNAKLDKMRERHLNAERMLLEDKTQMDKAARAGH